VTNGSKNRVKRRMRLHVLHRYEELRPLARIVLDNYELVKLVLLYPSPSAVQKIAMGKGYSHIWRYCVQTLARIKRDYPEKFYRYREVRSIYWCLTEKERLGIELSQTMRTALEAPRVVKPIQR